MNITNFHVVWYALGFVFAPRITLAVLFSVYVPVHIVLKVLIWVIALLLSCSSSSSENK